MVRLLTVVLCATIGSAPAFATGACAHRGDTQAAPENTIPAFESAVKKGADQIEFDVQISKDGVLVLLHDPTLNRTTNGTGKPADYTFEELRALDAGSWFDPAFSATPIPTLREALEIIPPEIQCNVHLKNAPGVAAASAKLIDEMGRLDQCFLACTLEQAAEAQVVVPTIRICNMSRQGGDRTAYIDTTLDNGCAFIQLHQNNGLNGIDEAVKRLHDGNVTINYFGTEDPDTIRALADAGVDYILTDNLDLCLQVLTEKAEAK